MNESKIEKYILAEAINTFYNILNSVTIRKIINKTSNKIWKNKTPNTSYFYIFNCYCFIINNKDKQI